MKFIAVKYTALNFACFHSFDDSRNAYQELILFLFTLHTGTETLDHSLCDFLYDIFGTLSYFVAEDNAYLVEFLPIFP